MKGSILIGGTLAVAAAMGLGLWYSANSAYYYAVDGVTEVTIAGRAVPVADYRGIDADTSPLKMRACFSLPPGFAAPEAPRAAGAAPLVAPGWFDCFDAARIGGDLDSGTATALLAQTNAPYGFDTIVAAYPDGRAFMWRQINRCGEARFSGGDLPADCPDPEAGRTGAAASGARQTAATPDPTPQERT